MNELVLEIRITGISQKAVEAGVAALIAAVANQTTPIQLNMRPAHVRRSGGWRCGGLMTVATEENLDPNPELRL